MRLLCNKSTNFKSTTWYIATSGTSGTPKLVEHSYNSLIKSLFKGEKDKSKIWGLTYSVDKFADTGNSTVLYQVTLLLRMITQMIFKMSLIYLLKKRLIVYQQHHLGGKDY